MNTDEYRHRSALTRICNRALADARDEAVPPNVACERLRQTLGLLIAEIGDDRRAKEFEEKIAR